MEPAIDLSGQQDSVTNDLVKRIRKLRWMGMEDEARRLQAELTRRSAGEGDSVIATPRENRLINAPEAMFDGRSRGSAQWM
jgi:hypothetical protein